MVISGSNSQSSTVRADLSTEEWEQRVGAQFRSARLAAGFEQSTLAESAGVSLGAVRNLENGRGSTLKTIVRVARVLGLTGWLDGAAPAITVSPIAMLRSGNPERRRVSKERS